MAIIDSLMSEKQKAKKEFDKLKDKYAKFFKQKNYVRDYWWLDDEKCDTFNKLQKRYCDPYGRILYSRACISTHAGAMGDYALLGRFNPNGEKIYTGTTDSGFSLPLILATMSFYNITNIIFFFFIGHSSVKFLFIFLFLSPVSPLYYKGTGQSPYP